MVKRLFGPALTLVPSRLTAAFMAALLAILASTYASTSAPAEYEYTLRPGDALEVSVVGIPALKQRALIGFGGKISLALIGEIKVSGLTLPQAEAKIAQDLSNKVYQGPTTGSEGQYLILPSDVVVTVAEYRPIYVNGDVAKPGEYPFRPGMTVRQVIAVAGGYGLTRFGVTNPYMASADLRAEYAALWSELAREEARAWRLHGELGEGNITAVADNRQATVITAGGTFMKAEAQQYQARLADRDKDATYLHQAIEKASAELDTLAAKRRDDEEANKADNTDLERVRQLYSKGLATIVRVSDARRSALLSSDQLLQTIVQIANIERQRSEYQRELDKISSRTRIDDLRELQEAELRLVQIRSRIKSTDEKLSYTGLLRSQLRSDGDAKLVLKVHRMSDDGSGHTISANQDLFLAPGDVVEVTLQSELPGRVAGLAPEGTAEPGATPGSSSRLAAGLTTSREDDVP